MTEIGKVGGGAGKKNVPFSKLQKATLKMVKAELKKLKGEELTEEESRSAWNLTRGLTSPRALQDLNIKV